MKQRLIILGLCALLIASCGGGEATATPTNTLSVDEIQALAIETFSAALTQTALAAPSETPFPTLTASATFEPFVTSTGGALPLPSATTSGGVNSCYRMTFANDVSIPDDTAVTPGQNFTKTWKVLNSGTCAWDAGFKFVFVGGEQMSGVNFTLPSAVPPNATLDISVAMIAPAKAGKLRGNWRMQTAGGQFFGDEVYVQVVVGGSAVTGTATTGSGPTTTATITPTETPITPSPTPDS
ncbi:MAG: NBR1-Ig-like domain-containing protein [Anaerolineales bacterium]